MEQVQAQAYDTSEQGHDAYIESDKTRTTVGVHLACPNRRFVGGSSGYLCECEGVGFGLRSYPRFAQPQLTFVKNSAAVPV